MTCIVGRYGVLLYVPRSFILGTPYIIYSTRSFSALDFEILCVAHTYILTTRYVKDSSS